MSATTSLVVPAAVGTGEKPAAERKRERTEVARKAAAYDELLQQHKKLLDLLERNEISISDLKCPADSDFSECSDCCDSDDSDDDEPLAKRATRMC